MERDMNQSAMPTLCRAGCGFYGSSASDGYCSKCFKDTLKRKQDPGCVSPSSIAPKVMDAALVSAIENLVTPNQASCSGISSATNAIESVKAAVQEIEKDAMSMSQSIGDQVATILTPDEKSSTDTSPSSSPQKQKNRCDNCRKRVGLTGFQCRCGGLFCAVHRYSDMHECSFDYKQLGEQEIRKNNPVVKTEKIVKL